MNGDLDCNKYWAIISLPPLLSNLVALQHLVSQTERSRRMEACKGEMMEKMLEEMLEIATSCN